MKVKLCYAIVSIYHFFWQKKHYSTKSRFFHLVKLRPYILYKMDVKILRQIDHVYYN